MNYKSFFLKAACGLLVCKNDSYSTILEANDAFYDMVGYTKEEMSNLHKNRFAELVIDDLSEILKKVKNAIGEKCILDYEYRIRHKSGQIMWIHDVAMYDIEEDIFIVVIMDITYKAKALELVLYEASIDKITGLLNRSTLEKRIVKEQVSNKAQIMILIDLDNFKMVNDTMGHQAGDELLTNVGEKLRKIFGEDGIVGRLGGDEFMAFLTGIESEEVILNISQKIVDALNIDFKSIKVSASVGVVLDKKGRYDFEKLYTFVDEVLYNVKYENKGKYKFKLV